MMSTMFPLPLARMRPTPDSSASVWRSLSPLPLPSASATLSMNRGIDGLETLLLGLNSVARRISWSFTSSHSTGTAVRSSGIRAPSAMTGPLDQ